MYYVCFVDTFHFCQYICFNLWHTNYLREIYIEKVAIYIFIKYQKHMRQYVVHYLLMFARNILIWKHELYCVILLTNVYRLFFGYLYHVKTILKRLFKLTLLLSANTWTCNNYKLYARHQRYYYRDRYLLFTVCDETTSRKKRSLFRIFKCNINKLKHSLMFFYDIIYLHKKYLKSFTFFLCGYFNKVNKKNIFLNQNYIISLFYGSCCNI